MTDYSKIQIYKISCKDTAITECYIGSTVNFKNRQTHHRFCCKNENSKEHQHKKYQVIRDNGGWDNWAMEVIEAYPCASKREAETREQYWIDISKSITNKVAAVRDYNSVENIESKRIQNLNWYNKRTDEYKEQNLIRRRAYYQKNKEKLQKKALERYYANH